MSVTPVDDLEAAEDTIGSLSALLARLMPIANTINEHAAVVRIALPVELQEDVRRLDALAADINAAMSTVWCRPSCDEGCSENCGCPGHADEEQPHWPCPNDPDGEHHIGCGCSA